MTDFPIPDNEDERLACLGALDVDWTAPPPEIEGLCRLASEIAETPIALVSLVDAREQRFAVNVGLDGVVGTGRDVAFCAHAIMDGAQFVVPDAAGDARFRDNPLVTGAPGVRAYAGTVLEPEAGKRVGTLCVIDRRPRSFPPEILSRLSRIGDAIAALLVARRDNRRLASLGDELLRQSAALRHAADHDPLTGLLNQHAFWSATARRLAASRPGALMLIDADRFKQVNDRHGHPVGDAYLKLVANAMRAVLPEDALLGRLGGDEFAASIPVSPDPSRGPNAVRRTALDLRDAIRMRAPALGRHLPGTVSVGLALHPESGCTQDELYRRADIALYAAKADGRDCTRLYDARLDPAERLRILKAEFPEALAEGRLVPFYQPLFDFRSNAVYGYEALARWRHPDRGLLMPADFWPLFEDRETAVAIQRRIAAGAITDFAEFRAVRPDLSTLGLNVTEFDLTDPDFADFIEWALDTAGVGWNALTFEITESVVLDHGDAAVPRGIETLRAKGAAIALDDFGTGHATLTHLKTWPIDILKIDMSFTAQVATDPRDAAIVGSVAGLARDLGIRVICEGLESEAQRRTVEALGCGAGQGFLFSGALSAEATLEGLVAGSGIPVAARGA